jgi:hypothetical protein
VYIPSLHNYTRRVELSHLNHLHLHELSLEINAYSKSRDASSYSASKVLPASCRYSTQGVYVMMRIYYLRGFVTYYTHGATIPCIGHWQAGVTWQSTISPLVKAHDLRNHQLFTILRHLSSSKKRSTSLTVHISNQATLQQCEHTSMITFRKLAWIKLFQSW